jgi:NADH:quinone reductase (non-electrogenic)
MRASGGVEKSGLELNRAGQIVVEPNLLAKGEQSIFALGDCARDPETSMLTSAI